MSEQQERTLAALISLAVIAWCGAILAVPIAEGDLWFHLSGGRWLFEQGQIPRVDHLTLARAGVPWIDLHWGFQALVYGVYCAGGVTALGWLTCALGAAIAAATIFVSRGLLRDFGVPRSRAHLLAALTALPWIPALALRPMLRPELLTYLLLVCLIGAIARFVAKPSRWNTMLAVLLQIALANVQGLFVLGWILAAAFLMPLLLSRTRRTGAILMGSALLAAPLINPYGLEGWTFPFVLWSRIDGSAAVFSRIAEFTGSLLRNELTAWTWWGCAIVLFLGIATAWVRGARSFAWMLSIGGLAALLLAYQARRNLSFAALMACLASVPLAATWARSRAIPYVAACAGAAMTCMAYDAAHLARWHGFRGMTQTGFGIAAQQFPAAACERIQRVDYRNAVFCDLNVGGFLAFELHRPTLVDARLEVLGRDGLENYFELLADGAFFERTCDHFDMPVALVDLRAPHTRTLLDHLARSSRWTLVALDGPWLLFARSEAETGIALEAWSDGQERRRTEAFSQRFFGRAATPSQQP